MENTWDIYKIKEILPQRYPFLFIDRVLSVDEKEGRVRCLKNVTVNDYFFEGHFPHKPIMPGVIILEAMAQTSIILYAVLKPHIAAQKPDYFLGKVEVKYKKPVLVGDQLILESSREKVLDKAGVVKTVAQVAGEVVAEAKISFGVLLKEGTSERE